MPPYISIPTLCPSVWARFLILCLGFACLSSPILAVERVLKVFAPASATATKTIQISVRARTDAGDGEHVDFLHIDASTDGGLTWAALSYEQGLGTAVVRQFTVQAGTADTPVLIRARAAFRGGEAGAVDFTGASINWDDSWSGWGSPPARIVRIMIK